MRPWTRLLVIATVAALAAGPAAAGDKLLDEVTALGDAMEKAMLAGDLDTILSYYLDDAISLPEYAPMIEGKDELRRHHEDMARSGMEITSFESAPVKVWKAGDTVIEVGTYEVSMAMPGAPIPIHDEGKYLTIYQRQKGGALKVKLETWNTDLNPMMMATEHRPGSHDEH
jgi:uncharacterized protein (TIGR02246 family)